MQSLQLHLTGATLSWLGKLGREIIGSWDELVRQFMSNFFDLKMASINRRSQSLHAEAQRITSVIHTTLQYYKKFHSRCF
jgi:hypothetical protein